MAQAAGIAPHGPTLRHAWPRSASGRVSRASSCVLAVRKYTRDEGGPSGAIARCRHRPLLRTSPLLNWRCSESNDGLAVPWRGRVFINPPYGRVLARWVHKCAAESASGRAVVVALLPARPDTRWWHESVAGTADVFMLRGRLRFGDGCSWDVHVAECDPARSCPPQRNRRSAGNPAAQRRRRKTQTVLPRPPGTVGIAYAIATDSTDRRHALGAGVEGAAGCTSTSRAPLELLRTRRRGTAKDGRHRESGTRD